MTDKTKDKIQRALELQQEMRRLNVRIKELNNEYQEIMSNDYIYDKVMGLEMEGII